MFGDTLKGFTFIRCKDLGNTPARVHRPTKTVYLNNRIWYRLPEAWRKIILLHEAGHANLDTRDEVEADSYAFEHFAGSEPMSLKNTVRVLTEFLDPDKPGHQTRILEATKRALKFDAENFGNERAAEVLNEIESEEMGNTDNFSGKKLEQKAIKIYTANKDVVRAAVEGAIAAAGIEYARKHGIHPHLGVHVIRHRVKTGKIPFSEVLKHNEVHGFCGEHGEYSDWGFFRSIFNKAKEAMNKVGQATGIQKVFDQVNKIPGVLAISNKIGDTVATAVVKSAEGFAGMIPGGSMAVQGLNTVGSMIFDGKPKDQVVSAAADVAKQAQLDADKAKAALQQQADLLNKTQAEVDLQKQKVQQQADDLSKKAFTLAAAGTTQTRGMAPIITNAVDTLSLNATGDNVKLLQQWLLDHAYTDADGNPIKVDGGFGNKTKAAVDKSGIGYPVSITALASLIAADQAKKAASAPANVPANGTQPTAPSSQSGTDAAVKTDAQQPVQNAAPDLKAVGQQPVVNASPVVATDAQHPVQNVANTKSSTTPAKTNGFTQLLIKMGLKKASVAGDVDPNSSSSGSTSWIWLAVGIGVVAAVIFFIIKKTRE